MNQFTLFPLGSFKTKIAGAFFSGIATVFTIMVLVFGSETLQDLVNPVQQLPIILWLLAFGLYLMAFSKEKIDDERVMRIRYVALRVTAMLLIGIPMAILLQPIFPVSDLSGSMQILETEISMLVFLNFILLLYHLIFQIGLRFDPTWMYAELDETENIRRHPLFFLLYFAGILVLLIGLLLAGNPH